MTSGRLYRLIPFVCTFLLISCNYENKIEIVWDNWGIPHIYGESDKQLVYGLAWSQMHNHGNLILKLYGISRGKAAEYWGSRYLDSDQYVWTMDIPQLARQQYKRLNRRERINVDAFAAAINDYAAEHGDKLEEDLKTVLPLSGLDVVQHLVYAIPILPRAIQIEGIIEDYSKQYSGATAKLREPEVKAASNGWVIGASKSKSGKPILVSNTHFPWPNLPGYEHWLWHEAHLVSKDINQYGIGMVGFPALTLGFNDKRAWTVTMVDWDTVDRVDTYELTKRDAGYLFDGDVKAFEEKTVSLWVKESDGSLSESRLTLKKSIHGPVIFETDDHALALRAAFPHKVAGSQLWDMAKANNYETFVAALKEQNLPPLNIFYTDREDNILYTMVGPYPDRSTINYDASSVIPGDSSQNLWHDLLPYDRMPMVLNPASGFLQNANEPPWSTTVPSYLDPNDFPRDWASSNISLRAAKALKTLMARETFSLNDVIDAKFSNYSELAERVLDDLIQIGRASEDPLVQQLTEVLANWDRTFDSDSIGSVAFAFWLLAFSPDTVQGYPFPDAYYAHPFDPQQPLSTPNGLKDSAAVLSALQTASQTLFDLYGSFHVPWGDLFRFRLTGLDLPGHGAPGTWGVLSNNVGIPQPDGTLVSSMGDTWVLMLDIADPDNAMAVTTYSNASQPDSIHINDQLPLYAQKQLRKIWRTDEEIHANIERYEVIEFPTLED
jgi:acyl-homoserine-lactone acylase